MAVSCAFVVTFRYPVNVSLRAPTLSGRFVRLEPLSNLHAEDLWRAAEADGFDYMSHWRPTPTVEEFAVLVDQVTKRSNTVPFAVVMQSSGKAIGSSSYLDLRLEHKGVEIGFTWIAESFRGTFANPEMKLLMLEYAFETLECLRVQLKTDARNSRSQRAMEKLGCIKEGVLRNHMIMPDGFVRDSVMYSILDSEWPAVRQKLEERLAAFVE